jgi:hypothetical protein
MKRWTIVENLFILWAVINIKYFNKSIYSQCKKLKFGILKHRTWESIRSKINRGRK